MTDRFKEASDALFKCFAKGHKTPIETFGDEFVDDYYDEIKEALTIAQEYANIEHVGGNAYDGWMWVKRENGTFEHVKTAATLNKDSTESEQLRDAYTSMGVTIAARNSEIEQLRKENEELKAKLDKAKWQPIETAPKDGTQ